VRNPDLHEDGRELDPRFPEAVVYWHDPPRPMVLVAFMYCAHEGPTVARPRDRSGNADEQTVPQTGTLFISESSPAPSSRRSGSVSRSSVHALV